MKEHMGHKPAIESGAAMKTILEASPVGIVVFDHDARVLYTNPLADTIFDINPDEAAGLRCGDFIRCAHRKIAQQGCGHSKNCQVCPLLGAICDACTKKVFAEPLAGEAFLDRGPNLPGIWVKYKVVSAVINDTKAAVMAVDDITTWKNDQEKLHNLMAELSAIHEHAPVAMMLMDRDRRVHKVNGFAARFAGRPGAEMVGLTGGEALRCLHHLDDPSGCGFGPACAQCHVKQTVLDTFATKVSKKDVAAWLPFPRGETVEERYLLISTAFLEISGTERVLVCAQDMTEWKRAEKAVQESERKFRLAFHTSPDSINLNRLEDGVFLDINEGFSKIMGYAPQDVLGKSSLELNIWANLEDRQRLITGLEKHGVVENLEAQFRHKNGQLKTGLMSASVLSINNEQVILSITRDITERKVMREEKEKLQAQLQQAQKMESVGRLAGGVAHDFNNMLGVIFGHTEMALDDLDPASPLYTSLQAIQYAAERSAALTRQLLAFARKQTIAPKVIDINETVAGMLNMLRRLIGEDIDLLWCPGEDLPSVKIDPAQIDQLLANLCVNARDAIEGVGKITIETDRKTFDAGYCTDHLGFLPGEYLLLEVSDDGCGMDQNILSHIFEPFFTTKEQGKGTGLGLASVFGMIKQNNGFINVYSEPGQGTTFKIYLPAFAGKSAWVMEKELDLPAEHGHETVLLVEDEPAILHMTTMMLTRLGYTVVAAATPGEAIRLALEYRGRIDLLITDVVMPEMNGRELAGNLLSHYPDLKRLFMSGYTANVIAHHGVLDQGIHFIEKPFSMKELSGKVREVLDGN
jgi:PAS domain S-box-containing protein